MAATSALLGPAPAPLPLAPAPLALRTRAAGRGLAATCLAQLVYGL